MLRTTYNNEHVVVIKVVLYELLHFCHTNASLRR